MTRTTLPFSAPLLLALAGCSGPPEKAAPPHTGGPMYSTPFILPGIKEPPTKPAAEADLADGDEVVGAVIKGRARAYLVGALKNMGSQVVNDVVNKTAVTVTYCQNTNSARAFTAARDLPLPISTGGRYEGQLLLFIDGAFYFQKTGKAMTGSKEFPYRSLPLERVTWGEWKKSHPDTDVYVGGGSAGKSSPAEKP